MTLHIFNRQTGQLLETVEGVTHWTADEITAPDGTRRGFGENVGFSLTASPLADVREDIRRRDAAQAYLDETDYVTIQWQSETALGIPHHRSEAEYQAIEQQRQDSRELIRAMKTLLGE